MAFLKLIQSLLRRPVKAETPRLSSPMAWRAGCLDELRELSDPASLRRYVDDYDGHVREAALKRCAEVGAAALLPEIAARLNDWVPQVRDAAKAALLTLLPEVSTAAALAVLPTVQRLEHATRDNHTAWVRHFEQTLVREVGEGALMTAIAKSEPPVGRAAYHLLMRHRIRGAATLAAFVLRARRDVMLGLRVVESAAALNGGERKEIHRLALRSPFGAVRARGLRGLLSGAVVEEDEREVISALLDNQAAVRGEAARYLRGRGFDLGAYYREVLTAATLPPKRQATALTSLADLREEASLPFIRAFTQSETPALRKAAWLGWLRIAPRDKDVIALGMVRDDASSVRRAAWRIVMEQGAYIDLSTVRTVLTEKNDTMLLPRFVQSLSPDRRPYQSHRD